MCFDDLCTWSYDKHKIPHCRNSSKIQWENVERGEVDTPYTQTRDRSLSWLRADTSIKCGGIELIVAAETLELWNAISIKHQIIFIHVQLFYHCFKL